MVDPVSKHLIIDEVELFQVEKSEIGFSGKFIGTDYDFMFNPKLRQTIFDSCLDSDSLLIKFSTFERLDPSI